MSAFQIFHNSRCSKSRQALQILQDNNCDIEIILYLETDLDLSLIKDVLKKLSLKPRDILRTSEQDYKDNNLEEDNLSDDDLINLMIKHPKLIERPIVIKGHKAVLGRPPENVLELL
jgi:arsenate reductase